jgi:hypothetical protein
LLTGKIPPRIQLKALSDGNHAGKLENGLSSSNLSEPQAAMYNRTRNENGSYNTRCLDCFMTIASCIETEEELIAREAHHICPEKALADLLAQEKSIEAKAHLN